MKKTLTALAIALTVVVIGYQIADAGPGRGWRGCNGPYGAYNSAPSQEWQTFQDDTADLRKQLHEKRAEYVAVMNGDNVDKDAAQALWSEMFDLKSQIREKAVAAGINPEDGFGPGRGRGPGRGEYTCNGPRGGGYFCDGPNGAPGHGPGSCWNR